MPGLDCADLRRHDFGYLADMLSSRSPSPVNLVRALPMTSPKSIDLQADLVCYVYLKRLAFSKPTTLIWAFEVCLVWVKSSICFLPSISGP